MLIRVTSGSVVIRRDDGENEGLLPESVSDDVVAVDPQDRIQSDGPVEFEIVESRVCEECGRERPLSEVLVNDRTMCAECSTVADRII